MSDFTGFIVAEGEEAKLISELPNETGVKTNCLKLKAGESVRVILFRPHIS